MSVRSWAAHVGAALSTFDPRLRRLHADLDACKLLMADLLTKQQAAAGACARLAEAEFRVFSQFGDDGIIQYVVREADVRAKACVELGVGDYTEANTRLLLVKDGWRGLICDCNDRALRRVRWDPISWQCDLTIVSSFVTRDNIDGLLADHGFSGEIGLFSIDVDGNDYFVWSALTAAQPTVVVAEYNATFGAELAVSVPYNPRFSRFAAHYSGLYWGASLRALDTVARAKGYSLVGCNSAGNNCYFVRNDRLGRLRPVSVDEAFVPARYRDSRDRSGRLSYLDAKAGVLAIEEMPVFDVETGREVTLSAAKAGKVVAG
jgi:hypothetical protein